MFKVFTNLQKRLFHAVGSRNHGNRSSQWVAVGELDRLRDNFALAETQRASQKLKLFLPCQFVIFINI